MTTPSARFVINFDADTSGIDRSKSSMDGLKESITEGTSALKEISDAMQRLKGTAEVIRWEALPRDISKAENEVVKLAAQMAKLKADFEKAPAEKKEGIFAKGLQTNAELEQTTKRLAALKVERDKLAKSEPVRAFEDLKAGAEKLKQQLGASQTSLSRLGGTMKELKTQTAFGKMSAGADAAVKKVKSLIGTEGQLKALGVVLKGVAAAIVAVTLIGGAAGGFALWAADSARSARLLREAAAGGAEKAEGLYAATLRVEGKTSATREAVTELANEYARMKFSLGAIEGATTAVTIATQTMGSQVGSTIKGLIDRGMVAKRFWLNPLDLKGTGIAIRDVAVQLGKQMKIGVGAAETALRQGVVKIEDGVKAMGAAFEASPLGAIAKKQALALGVQFDRAKANIGRLFDGVKIEPFLEKLADVLDIFNETSETGKAIKQALGSIFQPLVDSATASLPLLELAILKGVNWVQKLAIEFYRAGGAKVVFDNVKASAEGLWDTLKGIADTLKVMSETAGFVKDALSLFVIKKDDPLANFRKIADRAKADQKAAEDRAFKLAFDGPKTAAEANQMGKSLEALNPLAGLTKDANAAGSAITDGVAEGVRAGIPDAVKAMTELSAAMQAGFTKAAEIHSPSALYRRTSREIPRGAKLGIEDETPGVARALSKMAEPPDMSGAGGTVVENKSSSEDRSINLVVNYNGGGTRSDARRFGQWLVDELETATLAKGLPA
jgi:hypothetical protein